VKKNLKKSIVFFAALLASMTMLFALGASAADLKFTPEGGGKWIFCNNPEWLKNRDLMNSDDNPPAYIMNNENLEPDLYDFLICHLNNTSTNEGYGKGYDIELDVEITAKEDSEITINKAFFDTPDDEAFVYSDGTWAKVMNKASCLKGLTSYIGVNFSELNGSWLYEAQQYEPVTIEIKKGETIWLSDYMDNYTSVGFAKPVQIIGELSLNSGKINFNVAAFKSGEEIGDRSSFDPKASFGKYEETKTQKGIADTLPRVTANLEYTIDYSYKDGDLIPNMVYNQYVPEGNPTKVWCTNLNPQDDIWSKEIAAESDLISLSYTDDSKLTYYGSKVKKKNQDNVWLWDPFHSDTGAYPGSPSWYNEDEYVPNYQLSDKRSNQGYGCSMGNYGVTETYKIKVKNKTNTDKYFEYVAETAANIAVYVEDENGAQSGLLKGENYPATKDTMASVLVEAGSEKEFSINMVLPINYVGGIKNSFRISNESHVGKKYEDYVNEPRAKSGPLTTGITAEEVKDKLPDDVKAIVDGNYDRYELIKSDSGYMLRYFDWDGGPYYYKTNWDKVKMLYFLDEKYNYVDRYEFDVLTQLALYYDGYYYVELADGRRYRSTDGQEWEEYSGRMPLSDFDFEGDEPSEWAQEDVKRAYTIGIAPYRQKDTLVYTDNMTREMFCDIIANMLSVKGIMPTDTSVTFSDTDNQNVLRLASIGIVSGYEDDIFMPDNSITRAEAAMVLYRTAQYMGLSDLYSENSDYTYTDDDEIDKWARVAVYGMNSAQIMTGVDDEKFAPNDKYTNEQSIATVIRLYDISCAEENNI
jgi:hypothetical protein